MPRHGWASRGSQDMIPAHAYVTSYFGDVFPIGRYERMVAEGRDASYSMDMSRRPDVDWDGNEVPAEARKKRSGLCREG